MDGSLVSLSDLVAGSRLFDIPVYQRSYAWEVKNLEDLWEDLYFLEPTKQHYFGTVLLKDSKKTAQTALTTLKRFDVIDGQQRLTTVLILFREIVSQLSLVGEDQLQRDIEDMERDYLKNGEHYKLNPLGADGEFFHDVVINEKEFLSDDTHTLSQRRIAAAKDFFQRKLLEEEKRNPTTYQAFLVELKRKVDNLQVIQYQVTSDADAIRIFETVNDRGRPLSNLEKTKSFLMHTSYLGMDDEDAVASRLEELNSTFSRMYRHFDDVEGTKHMERLRLTEDVVHRYHFINYISPGDRSSQPLDSLKKDIRDLMKDTPGEAVTHVRKYANDLERAFYTVKQITDAYKKDVYGTTLSKIFMVEQMGNIFPLMMACWQRFGESATDLERLLRLMEAFVVRVYLVGDRRSDSGESRLYRLAHAVHREGKDYPGLVNELRQLNYDYQSDEQFTHNLKREDFYPERAAREIKFLLSEYEIHLREKGDVPLAFTTQEELLSSEYEVEHIWAQHPSEELSEEDNITHSRIVHRLGNLTIASRSWNRSMGNKPFWLKGWQSDGPSYSKSNLLVQRELAELPTWKDDEKRKTWKEDEVENREDMIIQFALHRWAI